ncbi:MAG TPA: GIY-YIG nuclease family protein [Niabella sp.]|nr:GIY-YIG nuclease family protein [Niabella sp.]
MYYVYILESEVNGDFYKGSTSDYQKRYNQHNNGECKFTRGLRPWKLVFVQILPTKSEALIQEKKLKRSNKEYLRWLISQPVNILLK